MLSCSGDHSIKINSIEIYEDSNSSEIIKVNWSVLKHI